MSEPSPASHLALKVALGISSSLNVGGIALFAWGMGVVMDIRDDVRDINTSQPFVTSAITNDIEANDERIKRLECLHGIGCER